MPAAHSLDWEKSGIVSVLGAGFGGYIFARSGPCQLNYKLNTRSRIVLTERRRRESPEVIPCHILVLRITATRAHQPQHATRRRCKQPHGEVVAGEAIVAARVVEEREGCTGSEGGAVGGGGDGALGEVTRREWGWDGVGESEEEGEGCEEEGEHY